MSFLGLGGFEVLLILAVAFFVLGPKRLLEGMREGRKMYADLKRQRDTLQAMITEAIDMEDLKKQIDAEGMKDSVKALEGDLKLDQVEEEIRSANAAVERALPREGQSRPSSTDVDPTIRSAIPDIDLSGGGNAPEKADSSAQPPKSGASTGDKDTTGTKEAKP